jgi:predicted phage-related endonuclease
MLTAEQLRLREGKLTASFAPYLMAGDEAKILNKWRELVGDPDYVPDDLSDRWPVQFGSYIEDFALDWHQRRTGRALTRRREVVDHPTLPYVACTLDAYRADDRCVLDVKAPGAYRKIDDVCGFYTPQMIVQRRCLGADKAALLIVHGGAEPVEHPIEWAADYEAELWARAAAFMLCVQTLTPPVAIAPIAAPARPIKVYDMATSNAWATHAAVWISNRKGAKEFDGATKELKALVAADAVKAHGHGIVATRDRRGVTIKEA